MLKLRNIIWKIQVLVMSQLDPIRSSFDGICQKLWHHENVAADLFHICQRRWYRTGTIEKPALQRYAGEMVLQSSGSYEYSWLGQKSMGESYGTHHRLGHRPLHGCSPGHDPGASATAVRQRCSDADGSGWASPQSMVPSRSPRFSPHHLRLSEILCTFEQIYVDT